MSDGHWIEQGGELVECDLLTWARYLGEKDESGQLLRRVAKTVVGTKRVSTVFLGIDHRFGSDGPPLLYETMVFEGDGCDDERCERYSTRQQAQAGHDAIVDDLHAAIAKVKQKPA